MAKIGTLTVTALRFRYGSVTVYMPDNQRRYGCYGYFNVTHGKKFFVLRTNYKIINISSF